MGMSTHIVGFKPPDKRWIQMKEIWTSCTLANVKIPDEVVDFFNGEDPDDLGVEIDEFQLRQMNCVVDYNTDNRSGFELYVGKLPKDVKVIRIFNSW